MGQEIIKLTSDCLTYFNSNCYTQNRIDKYKSMWKKGILFYMRENKLTIYTAEVGAAFIDFFINPGFVTAKERDFIRSVQVLTDFLELGYIRKNL